MHISIMGGSFFATYDASVKEVIRIQASKRSMRTYGITLRYSFNTTQSKYKGTGAGTSQKRRM